MKSIKNSIFVEFVVKVLKNYSKIWEFMYLFAIIIRNCTFKTRFASWRKENGNIALIVNMCEN